MSNSLWPHGLYNPWNSLGQNTGVGSLSLLQGIFPTQGSNPGLPRCRHILYQLSHKESSRKLEWVAYPFFMGPSCPKNQTGVSWIAGRFFFFFFKANSFTNWALREIHYGEPKKWILKIFLTSSFINHTRFLWLCCFFYLQDLGILYHRVSQSWDDNIDMWTG